MVNCVWILGLFVIFMTSFTLSMLTQALPSAEPSLVAVALALASPEASALTAAVPSAVAFFVALLSGDTLVALVTMLATRWHSSVCTIADVGGPEHLTLQFVLTDFVVVLLGEKTTLVGPSTLFNASLNAPVPECTELAKTIGGTFHLNGFFLHHLIADIIMLDWC